MSFIHLVHSSNSIARTNRVSYKLRMMHSGKNFSSFFLVFCAFFVNNCEPMHRRKFFEKLNNLEESLGVEASGLPQSSNSITFTRIIENNVEVPDIPEINSGYGAVGYAELDYVTLTVELRHGGMMELHNQGDLMHVMSKKSLLLDVLASDLGLDEFASENEQKISAYFAGDILLTPKQIDSFIMQLDPENQQFSPNRKSMKFEEIQKWSKVIHFTMDTFLSENIEAKSKIFFALDAWSKETCIEFLEMGPNNEPEDYLIFTAMGGCASYVGKMGGPQPVHICLLCMDTGIITHLIGHALGLWHTHQRSDRDNHLDVMWNNIDPTYLDAFIACSNCNMHEIPYDMGSIMHSNPKAFANRALFSEEPIKTLKLHDFVMEKTIGSKQTGPSFYDIMMVNKMYCSESIQKCSKKYRQPGFGGYWNPKHGNCSVPICPEGYEGEYCERIKDGNPKLCGSVLRASENWSTFESPKYPGSFTGIQECTWLIYGDQGDQRIQLEFLPPKFSLIDSDPCQIGFVEVRNGYDQSNTGIRFCGSVTPNDTITSERARMIVLLRINDNNAMIGGFRAQFRSIHNSVPSAFANRHAPKIANNQSIDQSIIVPCVDILGELECRSRFLANEQCHVPEVKQQCAKTCGLCGELDKDLSCKDKISTTLCFREYLLNDLCDTGAAKEFCSETCRHCQKSSNDPARCNVPNIICPRFNKEEFGICGIISSEYLDWCLNCSQCQQEQVLVYENKKGPSVTWVNTTDGLKMLFVPPPPERQSAPAKLPGAIRCLVHYNICQPSKCTTFDPAMKGFCQQCDLCL